MQEFASKWDWVLKNVLPVLQLVMALVGSALGAGIGGWVAIKTTTKALEASAARELVAHQAAADREMKAQLAAADRERQSREAAAERERVARENARRRKAAEDFRAKVERYHALMWEVHSFHADLANSITAWANVLELSSDGSAFQLHVSHTVMSQLRALEKFDLAMMDGVCARMYAKLGPIYELNFRTIWERKGIKGRWPEPIADAFLDKSTALLIDLQDVIEKAAEKLRLKVAEVDAQVALLDYDFKGQQPQATTPQH